MFFFKLLSTDDQKLQLVEKDLNVNKSNYKEILFLFVLLHFFILWIYIYIYMHIYICVCVCVCVCVCEYKIHTIGYIFHGFQSQLEASYVSSLIEELWYNKTACLWMTIYIYIYIYYNSVGCH